MFAEWLYKLREQRPLVHCLTNYVTASDIANLLYAAGAAPIMADAPEEVAEITAKSDALLLNLGTLSQDRLQAMLLAGKSAAAHGKPCVLDPVGAGFNSSRGRSALQLLGELNISVLRGNYSELRFLCLGRTGGRGVDADDPGGQAQTADMLQLAADCARRFALTAGLSGPVDYISDGTRSIVIRNGHPLMSKVSGSGCMLSALTAAFLAVAGEHRLEACAAAFTTLGVCGELAYTRLEQTGGGNASYRQYLIDALDTLNPDILNERARYEIINTI